MQENFILRDSVICDYSDRLLGRLLPLQINAHFDGQVDDGRPLTPEELREELRRRGLPEHIFGYDRQQLEHPEVTQG